MRAARWPALCVVLVLLSVLPLSEQNLLRRKDVRARHRRHRSSRPRNAAASAAAPPLAADPPAAASPLTSDNTGASPRSEPSSDSAISRAAPRAFPESRGGGEGGTGATGRRPHRAHRADSDPTAASGMVEVASSLSRKRSRFKRRELRSGSATSPGDARGGGGEGGGGGGSGTGAAGHHPRRADADSNAADGMVELASSLARKENPVAGKVSRDRKGSLSLLFSSLRTCPIDSQPVSRCHNP